MYKNEIAMHAYETQHMTDWNGAQVKKDVSQLIGSKEPLKSSRSRLAVEQWT